MHKPSTADVLPSADRAYRTDIEGLRGWLAVAIVVYHLVEWPRGGVIGVDVFFVISGYLITRQLVDEHDRHGRISLIGFYARRARRILPVSVVVLVATAAASPLVWFAPRAVRTGLDAFAGLTFVENWHLIAIGHSYLAAGDAVSPLQHFWSLAVEEQFYVAWPVAVVVTTVAIRSRRRVPTALLIVVATAAVVFAIYSSRRTATAIDSAYFDTFARAWEFAPGIAMALLGRRIAQVSPRIRSLMATLGLVGVAVTALTVDPLAGFPWPAAMPAVLGAALIVGFGAPRRGVAGRLLGIAPALWVGRRSFSVYLWHFPLAIMVPAVFGRTPAVLAVTFALTWLLSWASFRFIEHPARRSRWLARFEVSRGDRAARASSPRCRAQVATVSVVAFVLATMSFAQMRAPAVTGDASFVAEKLGLTHGSDGSAPTAAAPATPASLRRGVSTGLAAERWPTDLVPGLDHDYATVLPPEFDPRQGCRNDPGSTATPRVCRHSPGGALRSAVMIGDSTAAAWSSGVEAALLARGYSVAVESWSGCGPIEPGDDSTSDPCHRARASMAALVAAERPDLVIVAEGLAPFESDAESVERDTPTAAATARWAAATKRVIDDLSRWAGRIALLGSPPPRVAPVDCASRFAPPTTCETVVSPAYRAKQAAEGMAARQAVRSGIDASSIDVLPWFCAADGRCPAVVGSTLVTMDRTHLTNVMSLLLRGVLARELTPRQGT